MCIYMQEQYKLQKAKSLKYKSLFYISFISRIYIFLKFLYLISELYYSTLANFNNVFVLLLQYLRYSILFIPIKYFIIRINYF